MFQVLEAGEALSQMLDRADVTNRDTLFTPADLSVLRGYMPDGATLEDFPTQESFYARQEELEIRLLLQARIAGPDGEEHIPMLRRDGTLMAMTAGDLMAMMPTF
ncbi:MAG: hypothetical protein LBR80_01725 [Deltaproteobacteria bacterium]|jgi:hypothetical protein|nr:hypothetical protein [Deltaproteobacteria bacterium]